MNRTKNEIKAKIAKTDKRYFTGLKDTSISNTKLEQRRGSLRSMNIMRSDTFSEMFPEFVKSSDNNNNVVKEDSDNKNENYIESNGNNKEGNEGNKDVNNKNDDDKKDDDSSQPSFISRNSNSQQDVSNKDNINECKSTKTSTSLHGAIDNVSLDNNNTNHLNLTTPIKSNKLDNDNFTMDPILLESVVPEVASNMNDLKEAEDTEYPVINTKPFSGTISSIFEKTKKSFHDKDDYSVKSNYYIDDDEGTVHDDEYTVFYKSTLSNMSEGILFTRDDDSDGDDELLVPADHTPCLDAEDDYTVFYREKK